MESIKEETARAIIEHKELYDYLNTLNHEQLIDLLKVDNYPKTIDNSFLNYPNNCYVEGLTVSLTYEKGLEYDLTVINRCKEALDGLEKEPNEYEHYKLRDGDDTLNGTEIDEDNEIIYVSQNDLLGIFLAINYNVIPLSNVFLDDMEEERKQHTIMKVIKQKIRFARILKDIEKYINSYLYGQKSDVFILGEVAKKFNMNFRIHIINPKTNKEELLREDNDGWIIKKKLSQIKYEVAKIDNHLFTYEKLNIPRSYITKDKSKEDNKAINKLLAYFMMIGHRGFEKLHTEKVNIKYISESEKITSLELINTLKKQQIIGWYSSDGDMMTTKRLCYQNQDISNSGLLKCDQIVDIFKTLSKNNDILELTRRINK